MMMQLIDFNLFFLKGQVVGVTQATSEAELISRLGHPDDIEDYAENGKFMHYNDMRVSVREHVEYIDLFFKNTNLSFEVTINEDVFSVNGKTNVTTILHMLNLSSIKWVIPFEKSNLDYLLVEAQNGVTIYYYLPTGNLERISLFL